MVRAGDITPLVSLDMLNLVQRVEIGKILGEISQYENEHKRSMLFAVSFYMIKIYLVKVFRISS